MNDTNKVNTKYSKRVLKMKTKKNKFQELSFPSVAFTKGVATHNGLYFRNVYLPEEVVSHILSYVDPPTLLSYTMVCQKWNKLIKSYSLWSTVYERTYKQKAKRLPWYLYYALLATKFFNNNMILNGNGQEGLAHWKCTIWEGDTYTEDTPIGANALPLDVPEFNSRTSCFATSYFTGYKSQVVKFGKSKLFRHILDNYKPHIYISEWVTGRFDCGCEYLLQCGFVGIKSYTFDKPAVAYTKSQWEEPRWEKVEITITNYPEGIEGVIFENNAYNVHPWKGHYGIKMAGGVVKLLFDSVTSLPVDECGHTIPNKFCNIQFKSNEVRSQHAKNEVDDIWNGDFNDEIYFYNV